MNVQDRHEGETTEQEWMELLDGAAQLHLGISASDLLRRLQTNDLADFNHVNLMRVLVLVPKGDSNWTTCVRTSGASGPTTSNP